MSVRVPHSPMFALLLLVACTGGSSGTPAPIKRGAFESTLLCGERTATVAWRDTLAVLRYGGESFELVQARAASGARYVAAGDSTTWLWNKGDSTRVVIRGTELPICVTQRPGDVVSASPGPYRARGNEPFWSLELGAERIVFRTPDGPPVEMPVPDPREVPGGRQWIAETEAHRLVLTVLEQRCVDDMSGMPSPHTVTVSLDGREYRGCGGETATLLTGEEWVVEDIERKGIIDRSRVTVRFDEEGRVTGRGGCNSYTGSYTLTGESLTIGSTASTMMACAPSLMDQEARFLAVLQATQRFEFTGDGALVLHAADGRTITARR
ncbi:MAG TPA: META domain-containing protein [Gemmatimonadales bacterium]|nr:META domain-containing protein [Gemmatimonadales bacterium]